MIEFDNVTKQFPDGTIAVDHLNLVIDKGSLTVFVGPSGCGKTTSMRMVNRMLEPTEGRIVVDGADVKSISPVQLRRGIGYVIQNAGLLPHRTVVDNVATVLLLRGESKKGARKKALDVMKRVGLSLDLAKRYPTSLSGGQQQRVGVARALAADPEVLLMDEPFSAVDPVVRRDLQRELRRLQSELHKTIIFVTHDMDEAVLLGDKVAVFGTGGVLQQYGTPADVLANPANDFVADLVGHDRGYRALSFHTIERLAVEPVTTATLEDARTQSPTESWLLVTDTEGKPLGWLDKERHIALRSGIRAHRVLAPVGSELTPDGTLRQALDSALSSPCGQGVVTDASGTVTGVVSIAHVIDVVEAERSR
ncbi:MAG: ATP-binding cassette domain-containing protein [Ancrocorticia sp.]|jgi:osmoprotectant transport system ATP-binding protein|nr:ATP-binding cassette domain-containing protein [Ancrocorticia sp.]MCI2193101.1 ATP-binding cassette domain-containing protein [Ancrocorticia sp.]MCI2199247.1 ATP-binding cassette domain-containing protein [Ancrocorticia sp.]